ncbi:MAG: transaldolase family protein [Alphaproteobacteria bacterium]|nr:transaldolase family protein [Alphaproteobacteria bacterium]
MKFFAEINETESKDQWHVHELRELREADLISGLIINDPNFPEMESVVFNLCNTVKCSVFMPLKTECGRGDDFAKTVYRIIDSLKKHFSLENSENVAIQFPITWESMKACRQLRRKGIEVILGPCFSVNQALLSARVGASFVSFSIKNLMDAGIDGIELLRDVRIVYDSYEDITTNILAHSIHGCIDVQRLAISNDVDVVALSGSVFRSLLSCSPTEGRPL